MIENVYEIRKSKELYFILPDNYVVNKDVKYQDSMAVIVNLYYLDNVQWYLEQLYKISHLVDIYIISSNPDIISMVCDKNMHIIKKENRGRDISALLVSSKEIVLKYDYICFLHDKKAKNASTIMRTKSLVKNIWFNMIGSKDYILNIYGVFKENSNIGLLVPPEQAGIDWDLWGKSLWGENFERVRHICEEWELTCNLDPQIPPITIGTAFWCRTKVLEKLFNRNWKYEDFDTEPLPDDGTLSHAIERIFAYVAQDAGYDTGTVLNERCACRQQLMYQEYISKAFDILRSDWGITSFSGIDNYFRQNKVIQDFCDTFDKIYLYGAGKIGQECMRRMKVIGIKINGMILTKVGMNMITENTISIDMIEPVDNIGIIVSVGNALKGEIVDILEEKGFHHYICYIDL
jgi:rhamnosyltransferase